MKERDIEGVIDLDQGKRSIEDERSKNVKEKAIIYSVLMLVFSFVILFSSGGVYSFLIIVLSLFFSIGFPLLIATILEFYRKSKREKKQIETGIEVLKNPMWFEIIESTFSIFILLMLVSSIPLLLSYFR